MTIKAKDEYCLHCGQMHPRWSDGCENTPGKKDATLSLMHKTSELDWAEDFPHENGNYQNKCCKCNEVFFGHKRRVVCKKCATKPQYEISDEQIEKLADEYLQKVGYVDNPELIRHDFIEGAKAILSLIKQLKQK